MIFWFLAAAFLLLLVALARAASLGDQYAETFIVPALDDHHLTIYERLPLYDWEERGDL